MMNEDRRSEERQRARNHPLRRAMLDALGSEQLTVRELAAALPNGPATEVVAYHLGVLRGVSLAGGTGGLYRALP